MKKTNLFTWTRLLRTMVALLVALSMVLCGCANTGDGGDGDKQNNPQTNIFGDGDGKLEAQDAVDSLTNLYGSLLGAFGGNQSENAGYELDLVVSLGDTLLQQLSNAMQQAELGSDLSWFENVGLSLKSSTDGDMVQMAVDAQLNGKSIVSADMIVDILGNMAYIRVPELDSQYFGGEVDFSAMQGALQSSAAMMEEYGELIKDMPTDKALNSVLTRYLNVALEKLGEPSKDEGNLTVGNITQKQSFTKYTITRHDVLDIATAILTTAKTDEELEEVLDDFCAVVNAVGHKQAQENGHHWENVDLHAQLMEEIDPMLSDIQEAKANTENLDVLHFVVWADGEKTAGIELQVVDSGRAQTVLQVLSAKDGKNTGFYMSVMDRIRIEGTGTTSGGKISGRYTLRTYNTDVVYVELKDFDTKALQKGELKGTLRISFADVLVDQMSNSMPISEDTVIELVLNIAGKKAQLDLNLYEDDMLLFGIAMTSKITSGDKIKVPGNYVDAMDSSAMQQWAEGLKFTTVLNNLQSAGVPSKLVNMLEDALEAALSGGGYAEPDYPSYGY